MNPNHAWLLLLVLALACATPPARAVIAALARALDRVARVPGGGEMLVFLISAAMGAVPMIVGVVPPPSTHDEFAYLLSAETFASGRLTNPPHKLWEHFETFHQIMRPTYTSKFPPGQGVALAVGMLLGHPIIGAWGTVALACAAVCWMLRGWLPPRWALVGGLLAAAHPTVYWWGQIYWGGGVALLGGALLGGAVGRTLRAPRPLWGAVAGVGMGILALSRPFEGALVSSILMLILLVRSIRRAAVARADLPTVLVRFVLPAALALAPFAAWMMYYNWRVTGGVLTMPYVVHARQYMTAPLLWFQPPPPRPHYRHAKMAEFFERLEYHEYAKQRGARGFVAGLREKWDGIVGNFLAPPALVIALVALLPLPVKRGARRWRELWRGPPARRAAVAALVACAAFVVIHPLVTPWFRPQYVAPVAGFYFLLLAVGLWRLSRHRFVAPVAAALVGLQFITCGWVVRQMFLTERPTGIARQEIVDQLKATPGDDLVIVSYGAGPQFMFEWVYNAADIDASPVVFARYMDEPSTRRLREYYPTRRAWRLHVDGPHVALHEAPRRR